MQQAKIPQDQKKEPRHPVPWHGFQRHSTCPVDSRVELLTSLAASASAYDKNFECEHGTTAAIYK